MGQKVPPGLIRRGDIWYIRKAIAGRKIQESTGTCDLKEAERYLAHRIEQARNAEIYGIRPKRTFREAATKYLNETEKATLAKDAWSLKRIDPFIGDLFLENVHMGTIRPYIENFRRQGLKNRTINMPLEVVRHILNLAASEWLDENGLTWLQSAPKIRLLPRNDAREPYPLSWEEQEGLFKALPAHLRHMCLFAVNTGCRNAEICGLRWDYEVLVPELDASVFIISKNKVKNRQDKVIVLNDVAADVIEQQRGVNPEWVFTYHGHAIQSINNTAWQIARRKVGLEVTVHDLRHTFGRRLRAGGVSLEDRQDLLGHKSGRITTHYSKPELINLIAAANVVCGDRSRNSPALTILKKKNPLRLVAN